MAEYSHKRFICVINGKTITGWDNSADSYSIAPVGDAGDFTSAFGNSVWVDNGEYAEVLTLKLMQHHPDNKILQDIFAEQRRDLGEANRVQHRAYDPVNKEEIIAVNGRIANNGALSRGNAHNTMTWTIKFPKVDRKLP